MLNDDEIGAVVQQLNERHNWYIDNILPNGINACFRAFTAEVGINEEALADLVEYVIKCNADPRLRQALLGNDTIYSVVCHAIWAGIEIGKKVAAVVNSE